MRPPAEGQPLDWRRVAAALAGARLGYDLVHLDSASSTNDVARRLAADGAPEVVVVAAETQTAGRGRAGKAPWLTPPGTSIAVSLLLRPPLPPAALPRLGMAAGVAATVAIRETAGVDAGLKWPNDVVVSEGKLGGILVESALSADAVDFAIVGIGLNVNLTAAALGPFLDGALPPATLLDMAGRSISREDLLIALLRQLDRLYDALRRGNGGEVWRRYRDALTILGRPVRLHGGGAPVDGVAEEVSPDGALVLRLPSGARQVFAYGDVTLRC